VVDTVADEDLQNADCSLREAIVAANTNASYNGCTATGAGANDMIVFDLDPPTIEIGSTSLPAITESVTIDGGVGRVELHGPGAPRVSGKHGLTTNPDGSGTTIRNLVVNSFADDGIYIDADNVSILGCFIGTDVGGITESPNQGFGVHVFRGSGARIGGTTSGGSCAGDCNLISGAISFNANVFLDDNATGAVVSGNFIGTDVTGTAAIPNNALEGVRVRGDGNRIGGTNGTSPDGSCTGECNLISGNAGHDMLYGGRGSDIYRYDDPSDFGDMILMFDPRTDRIDLSGLQGANADNIRVDCRIFFGEVILENGDGSETTITRFFTMAGPGAFDEENPEFLIFA